MTVKINSFVLVLNITVDMKSELKYTAKVKYIFRQGKKS